MKPLAAAALILAALVQPVFAQSGTIVGDYNRQTIINQTFVVQGGGFVPQGYPTVRLGQFCHTQAGLAGPGQPMPVGSLCSVPTPFGVLPGRIVAPW